MMIFIYSTTDGCRIFLSKEPSIPTPMGLEIDIYSLNVGEAHLDAIYKMLRDAGTELTDGFFGDGALQLVLQYDKDNTRKPSMSK